jgi:hypothetical protein
MGPFFFVLVLPWLAGRLEQLDCASNSDLTFQYHTSVAPLSHIRKP